MPAPVAWKDVQFSDKEGNNVGYKVSLSAPGVWHRIPKEIAVAVVNLNPPLTVTDLIDDKVVALFKSDDGTTLEYYIGPYDEAVAMGWDAAADAEFKNNAIPVEVAANVAQAIGGQVQMYCDASVLRADGTWEGPLPGDAPRGKPQ